MSTLELAVSKMTCGHCVQHVTSTLSGISGVNKVEVDLNSGNVTIEGELPQDINIFINALAEDGYLATLWVA